jgi:hypothetical protein
MMVVTSVHETTLLWRKLHPKVQLFSAQEGGMLYWPACWIAYKRNPRGAPIPINQANLSAPSFQGRALSYLSSSVPKT